jgi:hypothetical protein
VIRMSHALALLLFLTLTLPISPRAQSATHGFRPALRGRVLLQI